MQVAETIVRNTRRRGNRRDWNDHQFAARSAIQLFAEACGAVRNVGLPISVEADRMLEHVVKAQVAARALLQDEMAWIGLHQPETGDKVDRELADVMVELINYADARDIDLETLALERSGQGAPHGR